ncbi:hypothetical protein Tco_1272987 [Tanacetum coccineum]
MVSPTAGFQFDRKVLNKDDPLSPFLFYYSWKVSYFISKSVAGVNGAKGNITSLILVLDCFHKVSGLKSICGKSKISWALKLIMVFHSILNLSSKFFNGHESSGKKASWVQWKKALAPKDNGGLDVVLDIESLFVVIVMSGLKQ